MSTKHHNIIRILFFLACLAFSNYIMYQRVLYWREQTFIMQEKYDDCVDDNIEKLKVYFELRDSFDMYKTRYEK